GMIVQQLLTGDPIIAESVVLAQTSPAFGTADGDWQKEFLEARLGPLDRGETMASLAPKLATDLVGDEADPAGLELARECMAAVRVQRRTGRLPANRVTGLRTGRMTARPARSLDAAAAPADAPIFDPQAFRLNGEQSAIIATARQLGQTVFAARAPAYDREAK